LSFLPHVVVVIDIQQPREALRSFRADRGPELAGHPFQVVRAKRVFLPIGILLFRFVTGR
jgi:hypothetical protein